MNHKLAGVLWRLAAFLTVCGFFTFAAFAIFAQLRFQAAKTYQALFTNISGLESGQFVRIAGVEVGKVTDIGLEPDATVRVTFSADDSVILTHGARAVIRYDDLIGGRYLALEEGTGGVGVLAADEAIPVSQTSPALDLDALIGGFRPLFRAMDPDQVNMLSEQLISAFEGKGETINTFFASAATLTNMLADRDQLIGEVIVNLNTVLGTLAQENTQFAKAVDSLSQLVSGLADRKEDVADMVAHGNAAAGGIADLLEQSQEPFKKLVVETDRSSSTVLSDHDYFDNLLATLPEAYQALSRQGIYGDFFSYYMCNVFLKMNGQGGQPVYVKVVSQPSGRCSPK